MASAPRLPTDTRTINSHGDVLPSGARDDFSAEGARGRRTANRSKITESPKNSISVAARRKRDPAIERAPNASGELEGSWNPDPDALPERISQRYERDGKKFYLGEELAFVDR